MFQANSRGSSGGEWRGQAVKKGDQRPQGSYPDHSYKREGTFRMK